MRKFTSIIAIALLAFVLWAGPSFAQTFDDYVSTGQNSQLSQSAYDPGKGSKVMFTQARAFDFSSIDLNQGSGVTDTDVIELFDIPPNTYIMGFGLRVTRTAQISGTSAEIGDGADIDGYVDNTYTNGLTYVEFDSTQSGASIWQYIGELHSGASEFMMSGVSVLHNSIGVGVASTTHTLATNHGPYFTSGMSPYIGPDTIDMTIYLDDTAALAANASGVTPAFEAFVWGFHVPTY